MEDMFKSKIEYTDEFSKIITFYLFECPVENVSKRGRTFADYNWVGSSRFQMLERYMKLCCSINDSGWILCNKSEINTKIELVKRDLPYIVCNDDKGRIKSIIYSIRNALAHGSFSSFVDENGNTMYYFENYYHSTLRAKMLIEERSLIEWIKLVKTNPEHMTKKYKAKRKK